MIICVNIQVVAVQRSEDAGPPPPVASLYPGIVSQRITSDKVEAIVKLDDPSFEYGPSVAGIEEKARYIPRMVLNNELIGIAAGELGTVGLDGIYILCKKVMGQAYECQQE